MNVHTHWSSCGSTLCPNGQLVSDPGTWHKCRAQNCQNGSQYGEFHSILSWAATLLGTPQSVVLQQDPSEFNSLCISPGLLGMGVLRTQGRHTPGNAAVHGRASLALPLKCRAENNCTNPRANMVASRKHRCSIHATERYAPCLPWHFQECSAF